MLEPYPQEFRDDVVTVARKREAPSKQIAKDFEISEGCLSTSLNKVDVEYGNPRRPAQQAVNGGRILTPT